MLTFGASVNRLNFLKATEQLHSCNFSIPLQLLMMTCGRNQFHPICASTVYSSVLMLHPPLPKTPYQFDKYKRMRVYDLFIIAFPELVIICSLGSTLGRPTDTFEIVSTLSLSLRLNVKLVFSQGAAAGDAHSQHMLSRQQQEMHFTKHAHLITGLSHPNR